MIAANRFPWGRYCNQPLTAIPTDYLERVLTNANLRRKLQTAIKAELARRLREPVRPPKEASG